MINNRFLYYKHLESFTSDLQNIKNDSIAFIEDAKLIWTHGVFFGSTEDNTPDEIPVVRVVVDDKLSTTSVNPVQNKVITNALSDKLDASIITNYYTKEQLDQIFGINAETLVFIQQLVSQLQDNDALQTLLTEMATKADRDDLDNYYTKTASDSKYLTKEEYDNYIHPMSVSIQVIPSTPIEYTGQEINVSVRYTVMKNGQGYTPDSVTVTLDGATIYTGSEAMSTIPATVTSLGRHTAVVNAYKNENLYTASASTNVVRPTYIFYSLASTKETVSVENQRKYLETSLNKSNFNLVNDQNGSYLWIITPCDLHLVTTDAGRAYTVDMTNTGTIDGLKYYRSTLSIDQSNINYWIS